MIELPPDFAHTAPEGFSYEVREFKRNVISIWLRNHSVFSYTSDPVSTIWGFYNSKKLEYYAPINSRTVGDRVAMNKTSPYTSMQLNFKGLESLWM